MKLTTSNKSSYYLLCDALKSFILKMKWNGQQTFMKKPAKVVICIAYFKQKLLILVITIDAVTKESHSLERQKQRTDLSTNT